MKHFDVIDGELAAVPVEERPVPGTIGHNLDLVILKLRSPDAEVWTACTATSAAARLDGTHFQEYILLSNGLIQRTPCECTLTEEVISYIDDLMIAQLGAEGIRSLMLPPSRLRLFISNRAIQSSPVFAPSSKLYIINSLRSPWTKVRTCEV